MLSLEQFVAQLVASPPAGSQVRAYLTLPPSVAPAVELPDAFPPWLATMLQAQGIERLAEYQWRALQLWQQGQHLGLSIPTGGGRGVVRLLALYHSLGTAQRGHALCIFPQKDRELAQLARMTAWNAQLPAPHRLTAAIYDGDTPTTERRVIKQSPPHLLLTTPEMLHAGILAYHAGWRAFFQDLRAVVLADAHLCGGALGAHMAHLVQRLHRISVHYGAQPQYLLTSAPIANFQDVVQTLTGQSRAIVSDEAFCRYTQSRILLEVQGDAEPVLQDLVARLRATDAPPLVLTPQGMRHQQSMSPHSVLSATASAVGSAQSRAAPTQWRRGSSKTRFGATVSAQGAERPSAHTVAEKGLTTFRPPPLVRSLVCLGLPASLTRLHEYLSLLASSQAYSVSVLILRDQTPLERYLLRYPDVYQRLWLQDVSLHPNNPQVARRHLLCATAELALAPGERYASMHGLEQLLPQLAAAQVVERRSPSGAWVATQRQPHRQVRLRLYEPAFAVVQQPNGQLLTQLPPAQAFRDCFEGAIYSHSGQTFRVERVIPELRRILVRPLHPTSFTQGLLRSSITEQRVEASVLKGTCRIASGSLVYTETLHAFERLDVQTHARTSVHALPESQRQVQTQGVWIDFATAAVMPAQPARAAVHTLVHAILSGLPLLLENATSLRGGVYDDQEGTGWQAVFVDEVAGGNGVSAFLYRAHERVLRVGLHLLLHCNCDQGCPRCIAAQLCATCTHDATQQRQAGIALLQRLLEEVVPPLERVKPASAGEAAAAVPRSHGAARHIYLSLTTQKSAEDVGGWQHKHLLGLGVAVTYDTQDKRYRVYTAETVETLLASLRQADLVIGFNLRDFDYQVLQPYATAALATLPTLALLDEVQQGLGFRVSLSHLVHATLGLDRPDDSLHTLDWFRQGERNRVAEHCRRNVELLQALVHHGATTGSILYCDRSGERRALPVHWQFAEYDG